MVWRGTTTATDNPDTKSDQALMVGGHFLRCPGKDGLAVFENRQTGVSLGYQRPVGDLTHAGENIINTINTEPAVGTNHINLQTVKGDRGCLRWCAEDGSARIIKGHLSDNRQITNVATGDNPGTQFADIEKGF